MTPDASYALIRARLLPGPREASWVEVADAFRRVVYAPYASRATLTLAREGHRMADREAAA